MNFFYQHISRNYRKCHVKLNKLLPLFNFCNENKTFFFFFVHSNNKMKCVVLNNFLFSYFVLESFTTNLLMLQIFSVGVFFFGWCCFIHFIFLFLQVYILHYSLYHPCIYCYTSNACLIKCHINYM